jgi:hypothetical protein
LTPYENLANAIIIQACKDYRKAYKRYLRRYRSTDKPDEELVELENFFRSDWYNTLTSIDGEYIMARIRKEVTA